MKDEEGGLLALPAHQFLDFSKKGEGARVIEDARFGKEFEPVRGFIKLLECGLHFADEFRIGPRAAGFAVLRTHRRPAAQQLTRHHRAAGRVGNWVVRLTIASPNFLVRVLRSSGVSPPFFILHPSAFILSSASL